MNPSTTPTSNAAQKVGAMFARLERAAKRAGEVVVSRRGGAVETHTGAVDADILRAGGEFSGRIVGGAGRRSGGAPGAVRRGGAGGGELIQAAAIRQLSPSPSNTCASAGRKHNANRLGWSPPRALTMTVSPSGVRQ